MDIVQLSVQRSRYRLKCLTSNNDFAKLKARVVVIQVGCQDVSVASLCVGEWPRKGRAGRQGEAGGPVWLDYVM